MDIVAIVEVAVLILISLSIHEAAHAWAAFKFGDDTAARQGRLSLNPMAHIDLFGTIIFPIVMLVLNGPVFGWAKPVPVNPLRVKNPNLGMPLIALAGPLSNVLQVIVASLLWFLLEKVAGLSPVGLGFAIFDLFKTYILINFLLATFNLLPVYPLDGSAVVNLLLSDSASRRWQEIMIRLSYMPFVILMFANSASNGAILRFWIGFWAPVFQPIFWIFNIPMRF